MTCLTFLSPDIRNFSCCHGHLTIFSVRERSTRVHLQAGTHCDVDEARQLTRRYLWWRCYGNCVNFAVALFQDVKLHLIVSLKLECLVLLLRQNMGSLPVAARLLLLTSPVLSLYDHTNIFPPGETPNYIDFTLLDIADIMCASDISVKRTHRK